MDQCPRMADKARRSKKARNREDEKLRRTHRAGRPLVALDSPDDATFAPIVQLPQRLGISCKIRCNPPTLPRTIGAPHWAQTAVDMDQCAASRAHL